jgi:predicted metal-dependent hydrolase
MRKSSRVLRSCRGSLRTGEEEIPYRVEWRRVKYPRLEFKTGNLLVILPPRWKSEVPLLKKKRIWILEKHRQIKESLEKVGDGFRLFGEPFDFIPSENGRVEIDFQRREIKCNMGDEKQMRRLREILRERLRERILRKVEEFEEKVGLSPKKIFIRRQRSKWASCSASGNLNFNLRLVSLPPKMIDYVVLHELLHLRHPRHDREFWGAVGRVFPDYREKERELLSHWFSTSKWGAWLFDPKAPPSSAPPSPSPSREAP